jgi:hypothetical protein
VLYQLSYTHHATRPGLGRTLLQLSVAVAVGRNGFSAAG